MTSKSLPCICGHEKGGHYFCSAGEGCDVGGCKGGCHTFTHGNELCNCKEYRPCIPLKDLRALWEEAKEEARVNTHLSAYNPDAVARSTLERFERKLKELEKGVD